ncbi:hypothetical protein TSUD_81990 [Trifolium subterraneum]|uniref:Alpha-1,3-glucosyltransferase n=1 Tax=Trifolium subterraneum TaxID=3900 RepID=A0A2Z6NZD7_TRISU|nr:hypothetical protein TSUD_81990 [Trifolium subterraneum]
MGKEKLSFKEVPDSSSAKTTLWWFFLIVTCIKVLLFPSYRSTDFEVHRNWLALTHSLPLSQWYFDETSPWTLDYPPFFAYFERFLSVFAHIVDPQIVHLKEGLNYSSDKTYSETGFEKTKVVAAPVYFVYLLRHYCWGGIVRGFSRLLIMGSLVVAVFASAFGPFFHLGQTPAASFTAGLVGDSSPFSVLPRITPSVTFIMVLLALSPCLFKAWKNPRPQMITRWISYAYTCGFLFGWHVHEKASLHFVIPLAFVAAQTPEDAKHYFLLSIVSCYSLFPLLFEAQEYPIKVLLLLLHFILMWSGFSAQFYDKAETRAPTTHTMKKGDQFGSKGSLSANVKNNGFVIGLIERVYLTGLVVVEIWGQFLHPLLFGDKLAFMPLMLISVYCALGIMYSWIWQLRSIVKSH